MVILMSDKIISRTDENDKVAEYKERWETIYVEKGFNKEVLNTFKEELIKDGYKVIHVVGG